MIETTVTTGKSGKTLPNKFLGTLLTLIGSNKNSVNGSHANIPNFKNCTNFARYKQNQKSCDCSTGE
jgi:hypothetical protein